MLTTWSRHECTTDVFTWHGCMLCQRMANWKDNFTGEFWCWEHGGPREPAKTVFTYGTLGQAGRLMRAQRPRPRC